MSMDYRLTAGESLAEGIKRVGNSLNQQAIDHIDEKGGNDIHEAIHEVRKRFKELRALVRLMRDDVGEDIYKAENTFYRDLGRELSDLRDSRAFLETLDDIKAEYDDKLYKNALSNTESQLIEHLQRLVEEENPNNKLNFIKEKLTEHKAAIDMWPVEAQEFNALSKSVKRTYKRGYKLHDKVKKNPSVENFHEWRKRAKYSRFHMDILRCIWPDMLEAYEDGFHDLTDFIGDDHDLVELMRTLHEVNPNNEDLKILKAITNDIRATRQKQALHMGDKLYMDKPKKFVGRINYYWKTNAKSYTDLEKIPQLKE